MLIDRIREKTQAILKRDEARIRGIWSVDCIFNPNAQERIFDFKFLVIKSLGQGCAYSMVKSYETEYLKRFIGMDIKDMMFDDIAVEVAACDSVFDAYQQKPFHASYELRGPSTEKTAKRAEIVMNECRHLLKEVRDPKVVNVGVVANIARMLKESGYDVCGTDFDKDIANTMICEDVYVYPGEKTDEMVAESDLAVITGMTLTTSSIDGILKTAAENCTKVVVFAETGANLGDFFLEAGADSFISEPFPFYIFDGISNIMVKRKNN